MATKPRIAALTNSSVDVLNAIRNSASIDYRKYVPVATPDAEVIRQIGAVLVDAPELQNEFLRALINRIGKVIVTSKLYSNPWAVFKKGVMDYGETIEEIFVDLAKPFNYDPEQAEDTVFKRSIPDARSAFHVVNYEKYYKQTIQRRDLERAFLSLDSVSDFVGRLVDAMYTAANYDEYQVMKYLLAAKILQGQFYPVVLDANLSDNSYKAMAAQIKAASNNLEFLSSKYNIMGVHNATPKREQYLIIDSAFDASMDVEVLASAFNMNKAEFMGHRILIDGFGNLDLERLDDLLDLQAARGYTSAFVAIDDNEIAQLNKIHAVLVDAEFFQVYDKLNEFGELYNPEGLYWNYWYHTWRIFSVSPFANAIAFMPTAPVPSEVELNPTSIVMAPGSTAYLDAKVIYLNSTPGSGVVEFYVSTSAGVAAPDDDSVTVDSRGVVTANPDIVEETVTYVSARSVVKKTVLYTAEITIAVPET